MHANRAYLPADFIRGTSEANRAEAIKQYGELNEKVANKDGTINTKARDAEFTKNPAKYGALNQHPETAKITDEKPGTDVRQPFTRQPQVNPSRQQSQKVQSRQEPSRSNYNNIQRAQSYHNNSWEQAQPSYHAEPSGGGGGGYRGGEGGGGGGHSSGGGGGGRR